MSENTDPSRSTAVRAGSTIVAVILASAIVAVLLTRCNQVSTVEPRPTISSAAEATTSQPTLESSTPSASTEAAPSVSRAAVIGAPVTIRKPYTGQTMGTITVNSATPTVKNPSTFSTAPAKNGTFWVINVTYQGDSTLAGDNAWNANPLNWTISDTAGYHYETSLVGVDKGLDGYVRTPGQKVSGNIVFDAPKTGVTLSYGMGLGGEDLTLTLG